MNIPTELLRQELISLCENHLTFAKTLLDFPIEILLKRPEDNGWNVLECLEHLNRYGDFYLPEVGTQIQESNYLFEENFQSGWLGNYSAESMLVKPKMKKMNTLKKMNPKGENLGKDVVLEFIRQTEFWLELLNQAEKVSWNKTKTRISILPLVKFRLGDTFRFVLYHNDRHIRQAERALGLH